MLSFLTPIVCKTSWRLAQCVSYQSDECQRSARLVCRSLKRLNKDLLQACSNQQCARMKRRENWFRCGSSGGAQAQTCPRKPTPTADCKSCSPRVFQGIEICMRSKMLANCNAHPREFEFYAFLRTRRIAVHLAGFLALQTECS